MKAFQFNDWHVWKNTQGKILLSDESVKKLRQFATPDDCINWLYVSGYQDAARALRNHVKADKANAPKRAKTRSDFIAEGRKSARMGSTRSPGNEYRMPVFGMGQSWQSKAFAEGFAAQCRDMGHAVIYD